MNEAMQVESRERHIYLMRGQRVMLDRDLAALYGVETRALNQAVKRNRERFPEDFMFQLSEDEAMLLVAHKVIPHLKYLGGYFPLAFSQEGIAMLSSVLRSKRAIQANIAIMRTFVKLRQTLALHKELTRKITKLETRIVDYDAHIQSIFDAIRRLTEPSEKPRKRIGFVPSA